MDVNSTSAHSLDYNTAAWLPQSIFAATLSLVVVLIVGSGCRPSQYPGVKGPKPAFFLGNLYEFLAVGFFESVVLWWREYGDVFKTRLGLQELLVVADAELVREVAVRKFKAFRNRPVPGEIGHLMLQGILFGRDKHWATARGASLPWFHNREHLERYMGLMVQNLDSLAAELGSLPEGHVINIQERLQALALDIFCSAAFGATLSDSIDSQAAEVSRIVAKSIRILSEPTPSNVLTFFVPEAAAQWAFWALSWVPCTPEWSTARLFSDRARLARKLLEKRRAEEQAGAVRSDVLTQLLRFQGRPEEEAGARLSPEALMFILGELIMAGSDTTSNTVTFAVFLLSTHPEAQAKVVEEIDSLWDEQHPPDSVGVLEKYTYVSLVVKEVLRLYPTGAQLFRTAAEDTTVGGTRVPKGAEIMFPLWPIHHNPKNFPDPDSFLPERFVPGHPEHSKNNMEAYMPFGVGPRMCLGYKFALQEATFALIKLYRHYTFQVAGELAGLQGKAAIDAFPVETGNLLKPKNGLSVKIIKRRA